MARIQCLSRDNPLLFLAGTGLILLPVSNAVGQVPIYLASVLWLVRALRRKTFVHLPTWIGFAGWALLILIGFLFAVHPEMGLGKLNRFLVFPFTGAVAAACLQKEKPMEGVRFLCLCLIAGVALLGIHDFITFPLETRDRVVVEQVGLNAEGEPEYRETLVQGKDFVDVGNMTSPQFYLVGIMLWLGLLGSRTTTARKWFWLCLPVLVTGLLIHQKRGVWLACAVAVGCWACWMRKWKILIGFAVLGAVSLCFPFVQERLKQVLEVVQPTHGGRMILWNEVAPRMFEQYPWGMGFNGSTYEDFREALPGQYHMEVGLRHLHNNFLQIRLELGWQGVIFWTGWMGWILFRAFRSTRGEETGVAVAVAIALLALHLNGVVEYNFGDSEVLKVFLLLFGCVDVADVCRQRTGPQPGPPR